MTAALERHAGADAAGRHAHAVLFWRRRAASRARRRGRFPAGADPHRRGRRAVPVAEDFLRQQAAASPLAGRLHALDVDAWAALARDLGETLRAHIDDDGVVFPIEAVVATARAAGRRS